MATLIFDDGSSFIEFDATPVENHSHGLDVTSHPVERGSAITDNARIKPDVLSLNCCFSDGDTPGRSSSFYERLRLLQNSGILMTVITSLRTYEDMILENISSPRTAKDAGGLQCTANFKEIRLVQNKTTVVVVTKEPITKKKISNGKQATTVAADGEQKQKTIAKNLSDSTGLSSLLRLK